MSDLNPPSPMNNGFDLEKHRLSQDFGLNGGVKKVLTHVPMRTPDRQSFVRTRPGDDWQYPTAVLQLKEQRETYLVAPELRDELALELVPVMLFMAITRQNVPFLWLVKLPRPGGKLDAWMRSSMEAAQRAMHKWVRVQANMALGAYEIFEAQGDLPEPEWPAEDFATILRIAFRDYYIDSPNHTVVRQLRGRA